MAKYPIKSCLTKHPWQAAILCAPRPPSQTLPNIQHLPLIYRRQKTNHAFWVNVNPHQVDIVPRYYWDLRCIVW
jgi:hypothetical protein